ncbi:MAG TPA: hypothetical protein VFM88_03950 [Vicinamibacteria bacterium]|nr:hypothetical protein [Vicinamibacteria bacterium]
MSKVAKIAIGCLIALFLAGVAAVVGFGGLLWWGKGKIQEMTGQATETVEKIESLERKANENPFTPPADGTISEDRLLKFIEIRKRVFAVYEKHKGTFEAAAGKKQADLSDLTQGLSVLAEIRTAQAQALADLGMSTAEYSFMVESVYKSAWAASVSEAHGGKTTSEVVGEAVEQARKQTEGMAPPEAAKALEELRTAAEQATALDVPKANVELFRKHESELKKYAMAGLELIGL